MTEKPSEDNNHSEEAQAQDPFAHVPMKNTEKKERSGFGLLLVFMLIILGLILAILSPLPAMIIKYLPQNLVAKAVDDIYKQTVIFDIPTEFNDPIKLDLKRNLPVFSIKSGLCFTFETDAFENQKKEIDIPDLRNRIIENPFVEIIVRDEEKQEYFLKEITVERTINMENQPLISVCHEFGTNYSIIPDEVPDIFLRPKETFLAQRVIWHTAKLFQ